MGHFNACDNRLITIMSKDRKDRKARTARARVSGPGFGPEKLEPDPDRGIYSGAKECTLGCVNPAYWLPQATRGEFTQPKAHSFALPWYISC